MRIVSPHSAGWLAAALLLLLPLSSCRDKDPHYPIVEAEQVKTANIEIYGEYAGQIKAFKSVEIHARVEGYLENMTFEEGKRVAAGEPLFYIDNAQYKAQVERARAQLSKDLAQEDKARRDVERLRPLYEQNATSRLELDNAEAAYNMAKASVMMSKAELAQAELELGYTVVRAPLDGYISEQYTDIGNLVGTSGSTLLATVVQRDTVFVEFKLTALDYLNSQRSNVHLGELDSTRFWQPTVTITLADNSIYSEKGIVDFAAPQVDPKTGTFGVRAIMPNPRQELLPGQFTRVKLLLNVLENATVVPRKAVSIEKGGAFIYVIRPDSIVEKRFIETGYEQGNSIVVNRGLLPGERIVVEGYNKLTHGQPALWVAPKQPLEDKPGDEDSPQEENIHFLPDSVTVPADTIRTDILSAAPTGKDSIPPTTPDSTVSSASATDSVGQQPADTTGQATSVNNQEGGQAA